MRRLPRASLFLILFLRLFTTACSSGYKPFTEEKFIEVAVARGYVNVLGETAEDLIESLQKLGVEHAVLMAKIGSVNPEGGLEPPLASSQLYFLRLREGSGFRELVNQQLEEGLLMDFFEEDLEIGENHVFTQALRGDNRFVFSMVDNIVVILDTNDEEKEEGALEELGHPSGKE